MSQAEDGEGDGSAGNGPVALLRVAGNVVPAVLVDRAWVKEVLVQVVDELEHVALHRTGHGDVVNQAVQERQGKYGRQAECVWCTTHVRTDSKPYTVFEDEP